MIVSLHAVINAMDVPSHEHWAFLNKRTGELVTLTEEELGAAERSEPLEEYPYWQQQMIQQAREALESDEYLRLPGKFDIHEYAIMKRFCHSIEDGELRNLLLREIRGSGAFRRFKNTIHRYDIAGEWYQYRDEALEEIAVAWLEANGIAYTRDDKEAGGEYV